MDQKNIPVYSEGEMVGGMSVNSAGELVGMKFNVVGTERLGACAVNDLDFVLELRPSGSVDGAAGQHSSLSEVAKRDESRRMAALNWVHSISNQAESPLTPEGISSLAKRIERFIRTGE